MREHMWFPEVSAMFSTGRVAKQATTEKEEGVSVVETVSEMVHARQRCDLVGGAAVEEGDHLMKICGARNSICIFLKISSIEV